MFCYRFDALLIRGKCCDLFVLGTHQSFGFRNSLGEFIPSICTITPLCRSRRCCLFYHQTEMLKDILNPYFHNYFSWFPNVQSDHNYHQHHHCMSPKAYCLEHPELNILKTLRITRLPYIGCCMSKPSNS